MTSFILQLGSEDSSSISPQTGLYFGKVVNQGSADKLFINTAGVGIVPEGANISASNARPRDKIIVSGEIGDHGIAVLRQRDGLKFQVPVQSDWAPVNRLVAEMLASVEIHRLRDPTRGRLTSILNDVAAQSEVGIRIEEGKIPVNKAVLAACELLGFSPLYIANEGKVVAVIAPTDADRVLVTMKQNKYGASAVIIGEVVAEHPRRVVMRTNLGASRIVDMPVGELLPRICWCPVRLLTDLYSSLRALCAAEDTALKKICEIVVGRI